MAKKIRVWNGTVWEDVAVGIPAAASLASINEFTTNQVIDASTSVAALRITQRGSGEAFRVEDSTNPDSSPFVITAEGNVNIGGTQASIAYGAGAGNVALEIATARTGNGAALIDLGGDVTYGDFGLRIIRIGSENGGSSIVSRGTGALVLGVNEAGPINFQTNATTRMSISSAGMISQTATAANFSQTDGTNTVYWQLNPFSIANSFGTATAQAIPFIIGNSNLERMRIDSAGNVGIGATPSGSMLTVVNNTAGNIGTIIKGAASQTGDLLQVQNSAGTLLVEVDSAGNVGIGPVPTAKLHVATSSTTAYTFISSSPIVGLTAGNTTNMAYFADQRAAANDGLRIYNLRDVTSANIGEWYNSTFRIQRNVDGAGAQSEISFGPSFLTFAAQSGEVMRITGTNVGIGTTTPAAKLDVNGAVKANNVVGANLLANGAFDISQRGVGPFSSGYTADRWYIYSQTGSSVERETSVIPTGATYATRITGSGASNFCNLQQAFEQSEVEKLAGKTVTFSVYLRANATYNGTFTVAILTSTTGNSQTPTWTQQAASSLAPSTSVYTRVSVTATIPTSAKGLAFYVGQLTGLANGSVYYIALAKAEIGTLATEFQRVGGSLQADLAVCQRYYYRSSSTNLFGAVGSGIATGLTTGTFLTSLPVAMRVVPTAIEFATLQLFTSTNTRAVSALTLNTSQTSTTIGASDSTHATGTTTDSFQILRGANSASAYIAFSAEL